jgi:sialic acid synthase SpsE
MKNHFKFIAELCQNHNGSFKNIEKMIYECAYNGANIIKLQNIFAKDLAFRPQFEKGLTVKNKIFSIKRPYQLEFKRLKKLEIEHRKLEKFIKICDKNKVEPSITCFTKNSVETLRNIGFKTIKVASYDCASYPLIRELSKKFNSLIISTGATYDDEIKKTTEILKKNKNTFSLLHCTSIYPTPFKVLNLARIGYLKKFCKNVGYSDHSLSLDKNKNLASLYAIYFGAKIIERHITILDAEKTKDGKVSITPKDISEIVMFSHMQKKKQLHYLREKYPINKKTIYGKKNRQLSHIEMLNRDYYRGRFINHDKYNKKRIIYNWEE